MNRVQVADVGEPAPALERETARQRERLEVRLLDFNFVLRRQRERRRAAEIGVNGRRKIKLRLPQAEAALWRPDLSTRRHETGDLIGIGVLRCVRVRALQDQRNRRVEGTFSSRTALACDGSRFSLRRAFLRLTGFCFCFRQPLFQRLYALLVSVLHLLDFLAYFRELTILALRRASK